MAGTTSKTEKFPKSEGWTEDLVNSEAEQRRARSNCVSCDQTADDSGWTLKSVWKILE